MQIIIGHRERTTLGTVTYSRYSTKNLIKKNILGSPALKNFNLPFSKKLYFLICSKPDGLYKLSRHIFSLLHRRRLIFRHETIFVTGGRMSSRYSEKATTPVRPHCSSVKTKTNEVA